MKNPLKYILIDLKKQILDFSIENFKIIPKFEDIEYGENLRDFFLIFFSLCAAIVIGRFLSAQKINSLVYLQHQLHNRILEGSILISFISNLFSIIAFAFSIVIALWYASWIKKNCSKKFWVVVFKDIPTTLLFSFFPYCSFWLGTCILSGMDSHYLELLNSIAPAFAWWNSNYLFIYFQIILTFMIFHHLPLYTSSKTLLFFCFLLLIHSIIFYISSQLWIFSTRLYAIFNFNIIIVYFLVAIIILKLPLKKNLT